MAELHPRAPRAIRGRCPAELRLVRGPRYVRQRLGVPRVRLVGRRHSDHCRRGDPRHLRETRRRTMEASVDGAIRTPGRRRVGQALCGRRPDASRAPVRRAAALEQTRSGRRRSPRRPRSLAAAATRRPSAGQRGRCLAELMAAPRLALGPLSTLVVDPKACGESGRARRGDPGARAIDDASALTARCGPCLGRIAFVSMRRPRRRHQQGRLRGLRSATTAWTRSFAAACDPRRLVVFRGRQRAAGV
mmetsp:Transcript_129474/g.374992  ORF Transcript_129474/g.374992 Transcript_129474/m.374992 type:complete len:247 (+) Transcript_129474:1403-2143(+)